MEDKMTATADAVAAARAALNQLASVSSLDQLRNLANSLSASASGPGGILYSNVQGSVAARELALSIANSQGLNIIDNTARALFLSDPAVKSTVRSLKISADAAAVAAGQKAVAMTDLELVDEVARTLYGKGANLADSFWGR